MTKEDKFECNTSDCQNAPTHVHLASRGLGPHDEYYCNKCCPLQTCPDAQSKLL
jgi:hypothetical protein